MAAGQSITNKLILEQADDHAPSIQKELSSFQSALQPVFGKQCLANTAYEYTM